MQDSPKLLTVFRLRVGAQEIERRIAFVMPPNRLTTQRRLLQRTGAVRTGAAMMRFGSNSYLTPALNGLILVTLLLVGAIVVRSVGSADKGGRVTTVSEHGKDRARATPENGGRVALDFGVADLRGALP
jgi:hypothetical protein